MTTVYYTPCSRTADQNTRGENQRAAEHDLVGGAQERRLHVAPADPGDRPELDDDDEHRDGGCRPEVGHQIWQGMAEPAHRRHDPAGEAPGERRAAPGERAVVG